MSILIKHMSLKYHYCYYSENQLSSLPFVEYVSENSIIRIRRRNNTYNFKSIDELATWYLNEINIVLKHFSELDWLPNNDSIIDEFLPNKFYLSSGKILIKESDSKKMMTVTFSDICHHYGLKKNLIRYNHNKTEKNLTPSELIEIIKNNPIPKVIKNNHIPKKRRRKPMEIDITIDGKQYRTLNEALLHHNLSRELYKDRRKRGWSLEKALSTPKQSQYSSYKGKPGEKKAVTDHNGTIYGSIKEAAKAYNLTVENLSYRISQHRKKHPSWDTLEKVFATPLTRKRNI